MDSIHGMIESVQMKTHCIYTNNILYDKLFAHFFSKNRPSFNLKDIKCFLQIVAGGSSHLLRSILAYYMKRILLKSVCECDEEEGIANIFNYEVCIGCR